MLPEGAFGPDKQLLEPEPCVEEKFTFEYDGPLGMAFFTVDRTVVRAVRGEASRLGVRRGFTLTKIGDMEIAESIDPEERNRLLTESGRPMTLTF